MNSRRQIAAIGSFQECVDAFIAAAVQHRREHPGTNLVALVGSNQLRFDLQHRLHQATGGGLGIWLMTFYELTRRLGGPLLMAQGRSEAQPLYQRALIARLLVEKAECGFTPIAGFDGAASAMLAAFTDLEEAGCKKWPKQTPRSEKLDRLGKLFDAYREELTVARFTRQDLLSAAAENAIAFKTVFGADLLHVVGIYDANPLQMRLLDNLAEQFEVRMYLPRVPDPPRFSAEAEALPPYAPPVDRLNVWSCATESDEVREVAREAKRLRQTGIAFRRMGILLRNVDAYAELLVDAFRQAEIPCRLAGGCYPRQAGSLRAVARLFDLFGGHRRRSEMMAFLGATPLPPSNVWRDTQAAWDKVSRHANIRVMDDWLPCLAAFAEKEKHPPQERVAATHMREAVQVLLNGLEKIEKAPDYSTAVHALTLLLNHFVENDEFLREVKTALNSFAEADRAQLPFSLAFFKARVTETVADVRENIRDDNGVQIVDMHNARGLRFDVVFIPGCVESQLPQIPRQNPVLLDYERETINRAIGVSGALPVRAERSRDELRLFDAACRAAGERLIVSYPRLDADKGRERLPSHFLLALVGRIVGRTVGFDDLPKCSPPVCVFPSGRFAPSDAASALDDNERDLAVLNALTAVDQKAAAHYLSAVRQTTFGRVWRKWVHRWATKELNAFDGMCVSEPARTALARLFAEEDAWAVTAIEDYVKCPRRYLFERLLKLEEPDDPEQILSLQPDKRGSLFHDVLMKALGPDGDEESLRELVEKKYRELAAENQTGGGVLDEVERDRLLQWAHEMAAFAEKQSAGYTVEAAEIDLGRLDAAVDVGGRRIRLRARLDRVDADRSHNKRIVDYKTGKAKNALVDKTLKDNDFNNGSTLQVPLYLLAYASVHRKQAAAAVDAAYWFMKNKKGDVVPNAVRFDSSFAAEKQNILKEVLRDVVEGIEGGRFSPRPDVAGRKKNQYCEHCSFKVICDSPSRAYLSIRGKIAGSCHWSEKVGRIDDEE